MAYQYLSFAAARSILSERLQDLNGIYFSQPNQLLQCLVESQNFPLATDTSFFHLRAQD